MSTRTIDFSKYETAAAPPQIDFSKYEKNSATPQTGALSGIVRGVKNLAAMPGQFYDAITKGPETDEEKTVHENGVDTPQGHIPGSLALPMWRLMGKPMADAEDKATQYEQSAASEKDPAIKKQLLDAAGAWRVGSKVPLVGPVAANLAERAAYGEQGPSQKGTSGSAGWSNQNADIPGALAEGTTYAAAPAVTKEVGGAVLDNAGPAVRATTRAVNTALAKAPGLVGGGLGAAAGAAIGHATGIPEGGLIGAVAGREIGSAASKALPAVRLPGEGFGLPNRVIGGPASAPDYQPPIEPEPVFPGAPQPATPPQELLQARSLAEGAKEAPEPAKALSQLPVYAVNQAVKELGLSAPIPSLTARANQIANLAVEGAGGKLPAPLEPNVPLKNQGGASVKTQPSQVLVTGEGVKGVPKAAQTSSSIPEGHTAVDSSAMKSYKYDPQAQEFEVKTDGGHYVYGDVSPEQAQAFEAADSKGKAWNTIRQNSMLVAKIVNGKRVPIKPVASLEDQISPEEWQAGHELETQVEGTPRR